jgi:dTDP-4-dehydrorhamnose 3,5-epimerase
MRFQQTALADAWLVEIEPHVDERGFFARSFCEREFTAHGLLHSFPQHSISYSTKRGTLRGMHFQAEPHAEAKLVRCSSGRIWDLIADMRAGSATFGRWQGFELSGENRKQLYIPKGFAHGFQTLSENAEVSYLISDFHAPGHANGFRYDDPAFGIEWPLPISVIADKDLAWPAFRIGQTG